MNYSVQIVEDPIVQNTHVLIFRHGNPVPVIMLSVYEWDLLNGRIQEHLKEIEKQKN